MTGSLGAVRSHDMCRTAGRSCVVVGLRRGATAAGASSTEVLRKASSGAPAPASHLNDFWCSINRHVGELPAMSMISISKVAQRIRRTLLSLGDGGSL